jgi:hypothetical protein
MIIIILIVLTVVKKLRALGPNLDTPVVLTLIHMYWSVDWGVT